MTASKARIRANDKYNRANYKQLKINVRPVNYDMIDNYCKKIGMSKAACIVAAVKYCMDNEVNLTQVTTAPAVAEAETETSGTSEA